MHYLDDYFTVGPSNSDVFANNIQVQVASRLEIPLASDTLEGLTVPDWQSQFRLPDYSCWTHIPLLFHWLKYYSKAPSPSHHYESRSLRRHSMVVKVPSHLEWPCYYSRPLLVQITQLALFTDASGTLGCGMVFTNDGHQIANSRPAILRDHLVQWEELYPIALSCLLWWHLWSGKKILFHCDYQPVVDIWASGTSQDPHIMYLDHSIFFSGATHNFIVLVSHIVGTDNSIADFLSCL